MAEDVDYMAIASMSDGMVGAELANIVEVAAINMMRDARTEVLTPLIITIEPIRQIKETEEEKKECRKQTVEG